MDFHIQGRLVRDLHNAFIAMIFKEMNSHSLNVNFHKSLLAGGY